jgi:hypothetical protein
LNQHYNFSTGILAGGNQAKRERKSCDQPGNILAGSWRWKRFAVTVSDLDPFFNDLA